MAPLIILTGLPATGKTTLGTAIAESSGWPLLSKDAIKEPLMAVLSSSRAAGSRALSDASFELLFALLPDVLGRASGAVLEGNFRGGTHESSLHAACVGRPVLQLLCRVPEPRRQARVLARRRGPSAPQVEYRAECDRFLDLPGTRIQLDGEAPLDASLDAIRYAARAHGFCV
jgi:predicted kinase